MSTAIIYIRVSTDEQAQKGYSQRSQEEKLKKYCQDNQIDIIQTIFEDHSAKNFDRPAWKNMMQAFCLSKSSRPDSILFTRWDRFSRNTASAYYVITLLEKMGIHPKAIDQPLDLSIPENKALLAMYIVTAEVENDRRSLNVKYGIYRAKQEGRWMGLAPIGYINVSMPDGRKTIVPYEPEATLVKKAFETLPESVSIRSLYKTLVGNGLKYSLGAFFNMLQNPVYCGRIRIKQTEGQPEREIHGVHQPLISEELFNLVQSRIKHPTQKYVRQLTNPMLMLRGILYCPFCSKRLTGSGSKGHTKRYFYYHCSQQCGYRVRADITNEHFLSQIEKLKVGHVYIELFERLLKIAYDNAYQQKSLDKISLNKTLHKLMDRIANARELLIKGIIDEEDHLSIKLDCEDRINTLGKELNNAYILDVQRERNLKKLASLINHLKLFFTSTSDNDIPAKVAALFLPQKLALVDKISLDCISYEARIVCGLPYLDTEYQDLNDINATDSLSNEQVALVRQIIKIEKQKGYDLPYSGALKVLIFLFELAKICVFMNYLQKTKKQL